MGGEEERVQVVGGKAGGEEATRKANIRMDLVEVR
jgi:hypothetical protein